MTKGRRIKIAGPQNELKNGSMIENARTHFYVRDRVRDAVQEADPRAKRRPTKASSRWPGTLSTDVL